MLVFLVVVFLSITIACVVIAAMDNKYMSWGKLKLWNQWIRLMDRLPEELVVFGTHQCINEANSALPAESATWILGTVWEVLVLCLAICIAVKHFCELQRPSAGWSVGDCVKVLVKTHVFYFAA